MNLFEETTHLMKNRPAWLKYKEISDNTGLHKEWLRLFNNGGIENPGIQSVQKLNDYLKGVENERSV